MPDLAQKTVLETNQDNEKSFLESVKSAVKSTKVDQKDLASIRDLAVEVGISNYQDIFSMREMKPSSKLERYINAKVNKLGDIKKVSAFVASISKAQTQEEMAEALGVPADKLYVLIPSESWGEISTDLFKKFLFFTVSYFIFNSALHMFKAMSGIQEVLAKCASHERRLVTAAMLYRQIKLADSNDDLAQYQYELDEDDLSGGSEVPEIDPADEWVDIDTKKFESNQVLTEKLQEKMIEKALVERGMSVSEAARVSQGFEGVGEESLEVLKEKRDGFLKFLRSDNVSAGKIPQSSVAGVAREYQETVAKIQELEEAGGLSMTEVAEIREHASDVAHEVVYVQTPNSYEGRDRTGLDFTMGKEVAENPDLLDNLAESASKAEKGEIKQVVKEIVKEKRVLEEVAVAKSEAEAVGGYHPSAIECSALNFASYGFVKMILKFFKTVAKGAYAVFSDFGVPAMLASAFTAMLLLGDSFFNKFRKIIGIASSFVKDKARSVWDFLRGERKLRVATIRTSGAAVPQEAYSKISLNMGEFVKDKFKELTKYLNSRDIENMREVAKEVGISAFKDISAGKEVNPSNTVEALVKTRLEALKDPSKQISFISSVQKAQSPEELASLLGVSAEELDESYSGIVNTRGWDYTLFVSKAFLFSMFCVALYGAISLYLGGTSALIAIGGAKTAGFIASLQAQLAPLQGVLSWAFGNPASLSALFGSIAKSSVTSGLIATSIAGVLLYGPRWLRQAVKGAKEWLQNKITSIFTKVMSTFGFKRASYDPNAAMMYFLKPSFA